MLDDSVIVPSTSEWSFPVVMIPKKDGSIRFCIDFRKLNNITVKDCYPLPFISELLNTIKGKQYFSTLDCTAGYWQIPVAPETQKKLAFITHVRLFEFTRMPFGVTNAPAAFQRLMDNVLVGLKWISCLVCEGCEHECHCDAH
jgi:hypothetical protein